MSNMMNNEKKQSSSQGTQQPMPPQPYYEMDDDEINLMDYWRILVERKWLIILITLLFTAASVAIALLMTPIYRAEVLLAPIVEEKSGASSALGQFGGLASMAGINLGGNESTGHSLAVLNSREFLGKFFQEKKLLPILFSDQWDESTERWLVDDDSDIPTIWKAYELFSQNVLASSVDKESGLVTVSIEWKDPALTAEWANDLVFRLNEKIRTLAVAEAQSSINYLQEQLQKTSVIDMHQVLYRLIESETQKIMLAKIRDQYAFKVIDSAVIPEGKIKPKRTLIVIVGFVLGVVFSIFLSVLLASILKQHKIEKSTKNIENRE